MFPRKRVTKKNLKLRTKPWINSDIQKLMSYRDNLFTKMVKSASADNKYLYSKFRNCVVSKQRKSKTEYYQNYFEKHKTKMKMLWTGIKSIVNLKAKRQLSHVSYLKSNDSQVIDPVEMANLFNHCLMWDQILIKRYQEQRNHLII